MFPSLSFGLKIRTPSQQSSFLFIQNVSWKSSHFSMFQVVSIVSYPSLSIITVYFPLQSPSSITIPSAFVDFFSNITLPFSFKVILASFKAFFPFLSFTINLRTASQQSSLFFSRVCSRVFSSSHPTSTCTSLLE